MTAKRMRRVAGVAGVLVGVWLIVLVILGLAVGGSYGQRVADRMAEALKANGAIGESELALVRGRLELQQLHITRDDEVGKLALDVREVRCELRPIGLALVDRDCRELAITGLRLEVSTFELFKLQRPKRTPIHAEAVTIEDGVFVLPMPLGRVEVKLEHARAGATTFKTPLSWAFALRELRARVELPFQQHLEIAYSNHMLSVTGSMFPKPVVLLVALPVADPADDPQTQIQKLVAYGRALVKTILAARTG